MANVLGSQACYQLDGGGIFCPPRGMVPWLYADDTEKYLPGQCGGYRSLLVEAIPPLGTFSTPYASAQGTITSDNTNVSDADTVTIGSQVFRFKNTMAQVNDIKIGADADTTLANLVAAINGAAGAGTKYFTGTPASTVVSAGAESAVSHTTVLTASHSGTVGNQIVLSTTAAHLSCDGSGFIGGTTVGTTQNIFQNAPASTCFVEICILDHAVWFNFTGALADKAAGSGNKFDTGDWNIQMSQSNLKLTTAVSDNSGGSTGTMTFWGI